MSARLEKKSKTVTSNDIIPKWSLFPLTLSVLLGVAKMVGWLDISWWAVASPIWLSMGLIVFIFALGVFFLVLTVIGMAAYEAAERRWKRIKANK